MNKLVSLLFLALFAAGAARADLVTAESGNLALSAVATGETLIVRWSADRGLNWSQPAEIRLTGESISQPRAAIDQLGGFHLLFLAGDPRLGRQRLFYTSFPSAEPRALGESLDQIAAPAISASAESVTVSWEAGYQGRQISYRTLSLDRGRHFGSLRSGDQRIAAPAAPVPVSPAGGAPTRFASPEITFRVNNAEPVIVKVELAPDQTLAPGKTWTFELYCLPGTPETAWRLPFSLPNGHYWWRLSAGDGFNAGPFSPLASFEVDARAPVISLSSPTGETSDDEMPLFVGRVGEPARVSLNGQRVSLEADGSFQAYCQLKSGQNSCELIATDEAGNTARLVKKLDYNAAVPHFKILRPRADDWYKPGAVFYFEALVSCESALEDESEGELSVNGRALADKPVYSLETKKISGFVSLPPALADGKQTVSLGLNNGRKDFAINIDNTPPLRAAATGEAVYSGSATLVPLPLRDAGSGLDPQGTLVKINGVSLEVLASTEAVARTRLPLADGSYEATVFPRDRVGNTGEAVSYRLIVDTQPPVLYLQSTGPAGKITQPRLPVSGEAGDRYLAEVNFYNGANLVGTINNAPGAFSFQLPLANGLNEIRVEAVDRAGNKTSRSLAVRAELAAAGLINKFSAAPVPYSPRSDGALTFTFTFSGTPDLLRIYVFDLSGTLIWRTDLANYAGNSVNWNGIDSFGRPVGNGLYPYLAAVSLNGQTEIKRGKLIVLN